MSKPASFRREALAELLDAATWYEKRANLGADFADEVERVRGLIAEAPV